MAFDIARTSSLSLQLKLNPAPVPAAIKPKDAPPLGDPAKYNAAYDAIKQVSDGADAKKVNKAIDAIELLSAHDAKILFSQLIADGADKKPYLDKFMAEMVDSGRFGGGVSTANRKEFFKDIAKKLGGDQLAAVQQSLAKCESMEIKYRNTDELANAVAVQASGQVKADFIAGLVSQSHDGDSYKAGFNTQTIFNYDKEARAISTVLASFKTDAAPGFKEALNAIGKDKDALGAVVNASLKPRSKFELGSPKEGWKEHFDPKQYNAIASLLGSQPARGKTADPELVPHKAAFVRAAGEMLTEANITNKGNRAIVAEGIEKVIQSDAVGVIEGLQAGSEKYGATALSNYVTAMVQDVKKDGNGKTGEERLRAQFSQFVESPGPGNSKNTIELLKEANQLIKRGNPNEAEKKTIAEAVKRANSLGYFIGALSQGVVNAKISDDRKRAALAATIDDVVGYYLPSGSATAAAVISEAMISTKSDFAQEIMKNFVDTHFAGPTTTASNAPTILDQQLQGAIDLGIGNVKNLNTGPS